MLLTDLKDEFIFDCQSRNLSDLTIQNYDKQLCHFINFLKQQYNIHSIEEVQSAHIKAFLKYYLDRQCKANYVNDNLKAIKVLCKYAFKEGYISDLISAPVKNVKVPRELIHTFSKDEIVRMIRFFKGNTYLELRDRVILMILFDTGIRVSELINMEQGQIRDTYFIIYGKGSKERVVPKNPLVSKWLMKYLGARETYFSCREHDEYVFLSKNGKKLTEEAIRKMMRNVAEKVGVNPNVRVSPHTARHSFAQQMLSNRIDLYSLSRLLGHESVKITERYLASISDSRILEEGKRASVLGNIYNLNH